MKISAPFGVVAMEYRGSSSAGHDGGTSSTAYHGQGQTDNKRARGRAYMGLAWLPGPEERVVLYDSMEG